MPMGYPSILIRKEMGGVVPRVTRMGACRHGVVSQPLPRRLPPPLPAMSAAAAPPEFGIRRISPDTLLAEFSGSWRKRDAIPRSTTP